MPGSIGSSRWVEAGTNEAGDPMYERNVDAGAAEAPEATGAAADLAEELGVDLVSVEGTGKGGKITVGDVKAAASG